jgi:hypothetical protein
VRQVFEGRGFGGTMFQGEVFIGVYGGGFTGAVSRILRFLGFGVS